MFSFHSSETLSFHLEQSGKKIIDVYSAKNTFPNFYNIRFYDIDNDGDYDMVPDQIANWGSFKYSSKLFWENINGNFLIRNL